MKEVPDSLHKKEIWIFIATIFVYLAYDWANLTGSIYIGYLLLLACLAMTVASIHVARNRRKKIKKI